MHLIQRVQAYLDNRREREASLKHRGMGEGTSTGDALLSELLGVVESLQAQVALLKEADVDADARGYDRRCRETRDFSPRANGTTTENRACETCGKTMVVPINSSTTECSRCDGE